MKPSMLAKLDQLANRLVELDELLMSEGATDNMDAYRKMTASTPNSARWWRSTVLPGSAGRYRRRQEMLADPDMKEFAQEEIDAAKARTAELELELQKMLLPKDPTTSATSSSKSAPAPAATNRPCLPATCCACTPATPSASAGRWRWCRNRRPTWAATAK
jgi:hypothetical protein